MLDRARILVRMGDVGMSLMAAQSFGRRLNRIQLQKFVYLSDVVGYLDELLPPTKAHVTYKHGPFDVAIQNAVEALVFRGLAGASSVQKDSKGNIHAIYELSAAGSTWVEAIVRGDEFASRWRAILAVAEHLDRLGWSNLIALVYAEPTYVSTRAKGYGQRLTLSNGLENSAAYLFEMLDQGLRGGFPQSSKNRELMVELLFRFLERYSISVPSPLNGF